MKTIWLVQLQYLGVNPWGKVVCACDSEEAAHNAGQKLAWMYNGYTTGDEQNMAGVVVMPMFQYYGYAVKKHEGEWI